MRPIDPGCVEELLRRWQENDLAEELAAIPAGLASGVSPRYARFLYTLVEMFEPQRILEVGLANGVSTAHMATAMRSYAGEGAYVAIDPFQSSQWGNSGRELLERLGLAERVRVVEDISLKVIPRLEDEGERFELVFLDGNHCLDYVLADVLAADRVLELNGLLVLDDAIDFGVSLAVPYLDKYRPNLVRVRLDAKPVHWLREHALGRRRLAMYQKVGEDERGPDSF